MNLLQEFTFHVQCLLKSWGHNQVLHECMERQYDRLGLLTNIHMLNRICCKNCCHYSRLHKSKQWRQEYIVLTSLWFLGTTGISHENMKINVLFCFFKKRQKVAPAAMNKRNPQNANEEISNPVPNWHPLPAAAGPGISAPPEEPCAWRYL